MKAGIAELLHRAFADNYFNAIELRIVRTTEARLYHWKSLGRLAPLRKVAV